MALPHLVDYCLQLPVHFRSVCSEAVMGGAEHEVDTFILFQPQLNEVVRSEDDAHEAGDAIVTLSTLNSRIAGISSSISIPPVWLFTVSRIYPASRSGSRVLQSRSLDRRGQDSRNRVSMKLGAVHPLLLNLVCAHYHCNRDAHRLEVLETAANLVGLART